MISKKTKNWSNCHQIPKESLCKRNNIEQAPNNEWQLFLIGYVSSVFHNLIRVILFFIIGDLTQS